MIVNVNLMLKMVIQIKNGIKTIVNVSVKNQENIHRACKEDYSWNPSICSCDSNKEIVNIPWTLSIKIG